MGAKKQKKKQIKPKNRYEVLDIIRAITLINMILYHFTWDLVYIAGYKWSWYHGQIAYWWQQAICWTFILLSGFCWSIGSKPLKRGLMVSAGGLLVTIATAIFMPENIVIFGVLTMIGLCMLIMIPLDRFLKNKHPGIGFMSGVFLFLLTRNINTGFLGFETFKIVRLPKFLYCNYLTTLVGFTHKGFYSTDYFSIIPWFFLFLAGYFLYHLIKEKDQLDKLHTKRIPVLNWMGEQSLYIYMVHQVVLYGIVLLLMNVFNL